MGDRGQQRRCHNTNCLELLAANLTSKSFAKDRTQIFVLHYRQTALQIDFTTDRQHYSGGLHKQLGRHSVQRADSPYQEHTVVVPGEEHTHSGTTPTWSNEHQEGSGIQIPGRLVCWKLDYQISLLYTDHWKRTCLHRD